jgi:hypothetical protein
MGDITSRLTEQGSDDTGLGRWTWQAFAGKGKRTIQVVTAYCPVRNTSNAGSVWHQHEFYADINNCEGSPFNRWIGDIQLTISEWMAKGDSAIVMADFNKDVIRGRVVGQLKNMGLKDVMASHYANSTPMFHRGWTTIDTILSTQEITILKSGYTRAPGDHLCVWMDVHTNICLNNLHSRHRLRLDGYNVRTHVQ